MPKFNDYAQNNGDDIKIEEYGRGDGDSVEFSDINTKVEVQDLHGRLSTKDPIEICAEVIQTNSSSYF